MSDIYRAIGDPTRRAILAGLVAGERSTGAIAADFPLSRPTISKHLGVLHRAGLVHRRQQGRNQLYTLEAEPLAGAHDWLAEYRRFWKLSLAGLKDHLEGGN